VGALFVDSNFDYNEVQKFFDKHMKPYFEDMSIYDTFANNHPTVSDTIPSCSRTLAKLPRTRYLTISAFYVLTRGTGDSEVVQLSCYDLYLHRVKEVVLLPQV
jgi:hypothetical protein